MTGEYHLPIHVIIEVMKGLHERVSLRAHVPASPGLVKQECVASITVDEHGWQTCALIEQVTGGKRLEGEEAFRLLQQCGTLGWILQPSQIASLPIQPPPEPIPARLVELTPAQIQALPPVHKKVFALVNGRNSLEYIAHLLTKSPGEISRILLDLQQQYLISL